MGCGDNRPGAVGKGGPTKMDNRPALGVGAIQRTGGEASIWKKKKKESKECLKRVQKGALGLTPSSKVPDHEIDRWKIKGKGRGEKGMERKGFFFWNNFGKKEKDGLLKKQNAYVYGLAKGGGKKADITQKGGGGEGGRPEGVQKKKRVVREPKGRGVSGPLP